MTLEQFCKENNLSIIARYDGLWAVSVSGSGTASRGPKLLSIIKRYSGMISGTTLKINAQEPHGRTVQVPELTWEGK